MTRYTQPMNIVQRRLDSACKKQSQVQVAREIGVSPPFISAVRKGDKPPSPRVLEYLGLELHKSYRRRRNGSGPDSGR